MNKFIIILFLLGVLSCRNVNSGRFRRAIDEADVTLWVYTQANTTGTEVALSDASNITGVSQFDTTLKTIFYVHGWKGTYNDENVTLVREALLSTANVNTIIVDWDSCAVNEVYLVSQSCVPDVGTYVGEFVETMSDTYNYSKSDITVVGHSLGAHIAGYMGKTTNGELGVIIGLDPAGPLYYEAITSTRLYYTDAQYVGSIHTNTLFYGESYGIGVVNYWPNGGALQNGCDGDSKCSHKIAVIFFAESVTNNQFYARECDSYSNFENGDCSNNTIALMPGINVDTSITGDFYLDTNAASPYGQGDVV